MMAYDPAFTNTASCRSAITYIDGEAGILQHRGYPDRAALRALELRRGRLPAHRSASFRPPPSSSAGPSTSPTTPSSTRTSSTSSRPSATTPTRWGCCWPAVGALSTFYPDAKHIDDPEERYMAAIRLIAKMPTLAAFAYRHNMGLPYVYPDNDLSYSGELPLDDVQEDRGEVRARPAPGEGARRALHPPRRPRAELLHQRGSRRRLLAGRPLLRGRGRRRRPLRPAARRRERGRAEDAPPDRDDGEHPRLPRGREEPRGAADGLRPPRLQELRPAGADHQEAPRRRAGGHRGQPAAWRSRPSSRSARSTTTTSPSASSTRTSTSTRGSSTRRSRSRPTCSR